MKMDKIENQNQQNQNQQNQNQQNQNQNQNSNNEILDFRQIINLKELDPRLADLPKHTLIYGLDDHKKGILAALLCPKTALFVFENEKKTKYFLEKFQEIGVENCCYYPAEERIPFEVFAKSKDIESQRAQVLTRLANGDDTLVFASIQSVRRKLSPLENYKENIISLKNGDTLDLEKFTSHLVHAGFERKEIVVKRGEFSIRGGIIDIFPITEDNPLRIELFDDEIDSIRTFDLNSQKSLTKTEEILIGPTREFICPQRPDIIQKLEKDYQEQLASYENSGSKNAPMNFKQYFGQIKEKIQNNICINEEEYLYHYYFPKGTTLLDYFPGNAPIYVDEPKRIASALELVEKEEEKIYTDLLKKGRLLKNQHKIYATTQELTSIIKEKESIFMALLPTSGAFDFTFSQRINGDFFGDVIPFFNKIDHLFHFMEDKVKKGYRVFLNIDSKEKRETLQEEAGFYKSTIKTFNSPDSPDSQNLPELPGIYFAHLNLEKGFEDKKGKNLFITELDIFNKKKKKVRQIYNKDAERIGSVFELEIGDFVVHSSHGIGQYFGINTLEVEGIKKDYLLIKYKGDDKLYVPVEQVNNLQKFVGSEEKRPKLNKLGGSEWQRTKAKVQQSIEDMSEELLELYAKRSMSEGTAFSPDDFMQQEFEENFPYEETEDQLRAIMEIKKDMEQKMPMDRLLCGDVGYGKTEVAMRGAFKAVRDSKQVAVLVPTTILAEQHFHSFSKRFEGFPVRVEVLSRFKSAKEEKEIKEDAAKGKVDILIGTHKLLSSTLKFKDLGLLIVDEEQRFGVKHKEKIKQIKEGVDVLTLSATPIPRTLQMSLAGLRDMSLIETPPKNRYPIQTFVVEKNDELLREVILRELGREGQVFYVHNRVNDIYLEAGKLMETVPEASFAIAHGQMREQDLEKTMVDFMEKEKDCLVCTTIIETGLDIPNVNTLIVDEADKYGLSQLYQLRGRVGRSERVAYAYLTYKADKALSENAEKRLKAIKDFTELGSGFKIALRDLEIRGAGNLLGKEQHGHLDAVGFALYTQMLQETIQDLKTKKKKEAGEYSAEDEKNAKKDREQEIVLPISALIPEEYIRNHGLKLEFYQKIKNAPTLEVLMDITDELIDRFGDFPEEVANLITLGELRIQMEELGITSLKLKNNTLEFMISEEAPLDPKTILKLSENFKKQLSFKDDNGFMIRYSIKYTNKDELLKIIEDFLKNLGGKN